MQNSGIPYLDGLVPAGSGEQAALGRVPVACEHVVVVGRPLLLTPVAPPAGVKGYDALYRSLKMARSNLMSQSCTFPFSDTALNCQYA